MIHVRLLGTSAGGGLPQWNCGCANCRATREGRISPRTQSSFAISSEERRWVLINASPDVRTQVEGFSPFHPRRGLFRDSPLTTVFLTNADLDHTLGLVLLREGGPLLVYATAAVREALETGLRLPQVLDAFNGVSWAEPSEEFAPLQERDGAVTGLSYRAILLPGEAPPYARGKFGEGRGHSVAYQIRDRRTGGRLLIAPDVAAVPRSLAQALEESEAVLFDGTFWSQNELLQVKDGARTAEAMGHLPIHDGSLEMLRDSPARKKFYVHINNTNPILDPASWERQQVERAGIQVGEDGAEFQV
ncbi:MAG TPA: pyrroloquinoline quinone biosynthesis protein PqqB [Chthoniobacterales bacterium]